MQVSGQYSAALSPFSRPIRIAYPDSAVRGGVGICARYLRQHWNKIAVAIGAGVLAGFLAGAVSSRENPALSQVVYAAGPAKQAVPEAAQVQNTMIQPMQEVSRLRAENQQLQALVEELQKGQPAVRGHRAKAHHKRRAHA